MSIVDDIDKVKSLKTMINRYNPALKSYYMVELENKLSEIGIPYRICSVTNGYITLISCIIGEVKEDENIEVDMMYYTNARYVKMGTEEELVFITMSITGVPEDKKYKILSIEKLLSEMNIEKI